MANTDKQEERFVSKLGEGRAAFLAEFAQYCLAVGERSPEDFIRHFSCEHIMLSLEKEPKKRAAILVEATGTHEKIAPRMSPTAAGETLQIALDEELATAEQIVELFLPDDRQRHLDDAALWAFATEGNPWKVEKGSAEFTRAQGIVRYGLERALHHKLLDAKGLVGALTVLKLTTLLPAGLLAEIIEGSLKQSQKFSHQNLLEIAQPSALVEHLRLDYIWEKVVDPLIADAHGYATGGSSQSGQSETEGDAESPVEAADTDLFDDEGEAAGETQSSTEEDTADQSEGAEEDADVEVREDEIDEEEDEEIHTVENEDVIDGVDTDDDDVFDEILDEGLSKSSGGPGPSVASAAADEDKSSRRKVSLN